MSPWTSISMKASNTRILHSDVSYLFLFHLLCYEYLNFIFNLHKKIDFSFYFSYFFKTYVVQINLNTHSTYTESTYTHHIESKYICVYVHNPSLREIIAFWCRRNTTNTNWKWRNENNLFKSHKLNRVKWKERNKTTIKVLALLLHTEKWNVIKTNKIVQNLFQCIKTILFFLIHRKEKLSFCFLRYYIYTHITPLLFIKKGIISIYCC